MTLTPTLCLASASSRRQALLKQIQVPFTVIAVNLDEARLPDETPEQLVTRLAAAKATTARERFEKQGEEVPPILGADTCVVIEHEILGKPRSRIEAGNMLQKLSGRTHRVCTGIALLSDPKMETDTVISEVTFAELTAGQIQTYCDSEEPVDKAGAYAIQGLGAFFVSHITGSYSGIMGLPLHETYNLLCRARLVPSR